MNVKCNKETLSITINDEEWKDIFEMNDGEYVDIFADASNMDVLFPDWRSYVDPDDILSNLRLDDVTRFTKLNIQFDETVSGKTEDGLYDIDNYDIIPAMDPDEDEPMVISADNNEELDQAVLITVYFSR